MIEFRGVEFVDDIDNPCSEPFVWGPRFKFPARKYRKYFDVTGDLKFENDVVNRPTSYRTRFGPWFANSTVVYGNFASSINSAVRRVTAVRSPEKPGYCQQLRLNQECNLGRLKYYEYWVTEMKSRATAIFDIVPDKDYAKALWAYSIHPKRQMRIQAHSEVFEYGFDQRPVWMDNVKYKCKKYERAKQGKNCRAVGDLGVTAALQCAYLCEHVKYCFEEPIVVGNMRLRFIKSPKKEALHQVFTDMYDSPYTEFVYFSDDSCIAHTENGVRKWANIDISSCDGSHFQVLFDLVKEIMRVDPRFYDDVDALFDQLLCEVTIRNPERYADKVVLKTIITTLFSGSTGTTIFNNGGSSMIGLSIMEHLEQGLSLREAVEVGAMYIGYKVSYEECDVFSKVQFLKHSPYIVDSEIVVSLNLGVIFRSFGECTGDLPGKSRLGVREQAARYNSEVVRSHRHSGENPVFDAFRAKFVRKAAYNYNIEGKSLSDSDVRGKFVPSEILAERYGLVGSDIDDLVDAIFEANFGDNVTHHAVLKILEVDYGIKS